MAASGRRAHPAMSTQCSSTMAGRPCREPGASWLATVGRSPRRRPGRSPGGRCRSGDLARGLRQAVPGVDATAQTDHPEEQHHEDREGDGEFDHRLTAAASVRGHDFVVTGSAIDMVPAGFVTVSVTVYVWPGVRSRSSASGSSRRVVRAVPVVPSPVVDAHAGGLVGRRGTDEVHRLVLVLLVVREVGDRAAGKPESAWGSAWGSASASGWGRVDGRSRRCRRRRGCRRRRRRRCRRRRCRRRRQDRGDVRDVDVVRDGGRGERNVGAADERPQQGCEQ